MYINIQLENKLIPINPFSFIPSVIFSLALESAMIKYWEKEIHKSMIIYTKTQVKVGKYSGLFGLENKYWFYVSSSSKWNAGILNFFTPILCPGFSFFYLSQLFSCIIYCPLLFQIFAQTGFIYYFFLTEEIFKIIFLNFKQYSYTLYISFNIKQCSMPFLEEDKLFISIYLSFGGLRGCISLAFNEILVFSFYLVKFWNRVK